MTISPRSDTAGPPLCKGRRQTNGPAARRDARRAPSPSWALLLPSYPFLPFSPPRLPFINLAGSAPPSLLHLSLRPISPHPALGRAPPPGLCLRGNTLECATTRPRRARLRRDSIRGVLPQRSRQCLERGADAHEEGGTVGRRREPAGASVNGRRRGGALPCRPSASSASINPPHLSRQQHRLRLLPGVLQLLKASSVSCRPAAAARAQSSWPGSTALQATALTAGGPLQLRPRWPADSLTRLQPYKMAAAAACIAVPAPRAAAGPLGGRQARRAQWQRHASAGSTGGSGGGGSSESLNFSSTVQLNVAASNFAKGTPMHGLLWGCGEGAAVDELPLLPPPLKSPPCSTLQPLPALLLPLPAGLKEGSEADELVAQELGVGSAAELSDVQGKYKDAIKRKLEEVSGGRRGRGAGLSSAGWSAAPRVGACHSARCARRSRPRPSTRPRLPRAAARGGAAAGEGGQGGAVRAGQAGVR